MHAGENDGPFGFDKVQGVNYMNHYGTLSSIEVPNDDPAILAAHGGGHLIW